MAVMTPRGRAAARPFKRSGLLAILTVAFGAALAAPGAQASPGLVLLSAGDLTGAERAFEQATQRDPASAEAHFHLGLVHSKQGRHEDALARFDRALALDPQLPDAQLSRGIALHRLGRHPAASGAFEAALRQEPGEPSALLFLGLSRIALGEARAAIEPLREAARRDPTLAQLALHNVGLAQWKSGDLAVARGTLDEAIALDPDSDTANDSRRLQELTRPDLATTARRWSIAGSLGFEFDDSVNQEEIDSNSDSGDVLGLFEFSPAFRLLDDDRGVLELGYDLFSNVHDANDEFDLESHGIFLDASTELGAVDAGIVYRFDHSRLDGSRFLQIHGVRPSLGFTLGSRGYVDLGYQFQDRDFAASRRDAEHHDVGFDGYFFFQSARGYVSGGYRVVDEDADGAEFDYLGHIARVGLRVPLPLLREAVAIFGYEFSLRDYDEVTPSIGSRRDDRRHSVRLGLEKQIRNGMLARLNHEFVESKSNLPSVDFSQNVVSMSLAFDF